MHYRLLCRIFDCFPVFLFGITKIQWRYEPHHKKQEQQKNNNNKRLEIGACEDLWFLHTNIESVINPIF